MAGDGNRDLTAYFYDQIQLHSGDKDTFSGGTLHYLTLLLTALAQASSLFSYDHVVGMELRPLAWLFKDAMKAPSKGDRRLHLLQMGQQALFVAGIFPEYFSRPGRSVNLTYYQQMGASAYASLAEDPGNPSHEIHGEVSRQFPQATALIGHVVRDPALPGTPIWTPDEPKSKILLPEGNSQVVVAGIPRIMIN